MCFTAKRGIKSHSLPLTDGQEVNGDGGGVKDTAVSGLRSVNLTVLWCVTFPYSVNMNHMKELQHTPSLKRQNAKSMEYNSHSFLFYPCDIIGKFSLI